MMPFRHNRLSLFIRSLRFFFQRLTRGWDDSQTWNLDARFSEYMLPRLRRFREIHCAYPCELTPEEWNAILDKMIFAMEWLSTDMLEREETVEMWNKVQEGMELFGKFFTSLWW
jgi:hypothetical protein